MKSLLVCLLALGICLPALGQGRDELEDPEAFLQRVKSDLEKVDRSIEATNKLLKKSADSDLLPEIRLRLAELYVEKSRLLYYKALEERKGSKNTALSAPESKYYKDRAIEQYQKILKEHPGFAQEDKVLFFLAHELKELSEDKEMLETYERLIKKHPRSQYVLESLLIVGNYYFDKQQLEKAERRYRAMLRRSTTGVAAMARYKLAWIELNREDYKDALEYFEAAGKTPPPGPGDVQLEFEPEKLENIQREALVDSVLPFTEERKPAQALRYYERLADNRFVLAAVLDKLANRYFIQEELDVAADLYRRLLDMTREPEQSIEYARRLYDSESKAKHTHWEAHDAIAIADATGRFLTDWRVPASDQKEVRPEYEAIVRDVATRVHVAAKKSKDPEELAGAAAAYRAYLDVFTADDANRRAIAENHAEALYESKQYYEAGLAFERIGSARKENEEQYVHSAIAAYQKVMADETSGRFRRVQSREGVKQLGAYYISLYPDARDSSKIALAVARSYYDAGKYEKAIEEFGRFIEVHPKSSEAYVAAHLTLDAYGRLDDFEGLATAGRAMLDNPRLPDPKFKKQVQRIVRNAEFRRVSDVIAESAGEADFEQRLMQLAEENAGSELAETALYNLFVTNRDKGNVEKTFDAGQRLLARYPKSDFVPEVVTALAEQALAGGNFNRAASYYEYYARIRPKEREATRALEVAAGYRAGIGNVRKAISDYERLAGRPGAPPGRKLATESLLAARRVGDWSLMGAQGQRMIKAGADRPLARWAVGYALWQKGERAAASRQLQRAVALWDGRGSDLDRDAAGHAAFLLADDTWRRFQALRIANANDTQGVQAMVAGAQAVEEAYATAVQTGSGTWGVAGLYRGGAAYRRLAKAIRSVPPPSGLSGAEQREYRQIIEQQVAPIEQTARAAFSACVQRAVELKVFSRFVPACASGGRDRPAARIDPPKPRGTRPPASLVDTLRSDPTDVDLLEQTARGHLAAGDPYTAEMMARRALEQDEHRGDVHTILGVALLRRGAVQEAYYAFARAAEVSPDDAAVQLSLAAHHFAYGDPRRARAILRKVSSLRGVDTSGPEVHPAARALLRQIRQGPRVGPSARRER